MKKLFRYLSYFLMLALTAPAWGGGLNVVASFTVLADLVRAVGGEHVTVRSLVGANGDAHVYEPTPTDSATLAHADLVVVSGLGLEGWMERLITASGYRGPLVVASDGITTRVITEAGHQDIPDPHAWMNVANGIIYAANIQKALIAIDPAHSADYVRSGNLYLEELKKLDDWARQEIETIPPTQRKIITSHQAFGYLGAAYGIKFLAPLGFSTESEPSARQVAALIDQIRTEKIRALFIENATDGRLVRQIAQETGACLGGYLYAEALSQDDGPAPSYIKMIQYDIHTMKIGMTNECNTPERAL